MSISNKFCRSDCTNNYTNIQNEYNGKSVYVIALEEELNFDLKLYNQKQNLTLKQELNS